LIAAFTALLNTSLNRAVCTDAEDQWRWATVTRFNEKKMMHFTFGQAGRSFQEQKTF